MDSSYISLLIFILITIFYYLVLKPKLSVSTIENEDEYTAYTKSNYMKIIIYFIMIILSQLVINANIIISKCGGSITNNIGSAFLLTFVPWIFWYFDCSACYLSRF